jgi:hypothetical protein
LGGLKNYTAQYAQNIDQITPQAGLTPF